MLWRKHFCYQLILCLLLSNAKALPFDLENYRVSSGGLLDIQDGAFIEGSSSQGGIQPDYRIDLGSEPLRSYLLRCKAIGNLILPFWQKVEMILELTANDYFHYSDYHNPYYRRLLKQYRKSGTDVPLSEYGVSAAGVCREYALVLHFGLKAAGIGNKFAYAKIYRASNYNHYRIVEDHAFNVVSFQGVEWVVDAYYWGFNGFRLDDLLRGPGISEESLSAPIAAPQPGTRKILYFNDFPRVYNPLPVQSCARILSK